MDKSGNSGKKNQQPSELHCLQIFTRTYQAITGKLVPQQLLGEIIDYLCFMKHKATAFFFFFSYLKASAILHSITHSNFLTFVSAFL